MTKILIVVCLIGALLRWPANGADASRRMRRCVWGGVVAPAAESHLRHSGVAGSTVSKRGRASRTNVTHGRRPTVRATAGMGVCHAIATLTGHSPGLCVFARQRNAPEGLHGQASATWRALVIAENRRRK
ncbi:exported hypothetical protein [Xanthomonas citri pv. fuscans]|nr:exported hypothetical protein [Xanthomonas citri pv. fuscans]SOO16200.1 exported hypothetical protein [Xanthomonas citri pv. fuscans]